MAIATITSEVKTQEAGMSKLVSYVPQLLASKGWDVKTFAAYMMLKGAGQDTAYRLARGDTDVTTKTLELAAEVLEVCSIAQIMDVDKEQLG